MEKKKRLVLKGEKTKLYKKEIGKEKEDEKRRDLYSREKKLIHTERKLEREKDERERKEKGWRHYWDLIHQSLEGRKIEKGSVSICDSWFYCNGRHTRRNTWKDRQPPEVVGGINAPRGEL